MIMDSVHFTGAVKKDTLNWQNYLSAEERALMLPTEVMIHLCI